MTTKEQPFRRFPGGIFFRDPEGIGLSMIYMHEFDRRLPSFIYNIEMALNLAYQKGFEEGSIAQKEDTALKTGRG
jgi:hypothetical protein